MRHLHWLLTTGLAAATLLGTSTSFAQPEVRDHRYNAGPRDAPPPPRVENHEAVRAGFYWHAGQWDWANGSWQWTAGHWERVRNGKKWRPHRWERRGDVFVKIDGDYIDVDIHPRAAPPPPREESFAPRAGFVFVRGNWEWRDGEWQWIPGHWERERAAQRWIEAHWEQRGDHWELVAGHWAGADPYPTAAPPPRRIETILSRPGHVWVAGSWEWRNGQWEWLPGRLEIERAGQRWREARWENRGGRWELVAGGWEVAPVSPYPTSPPPPLRDERPVARNGFVFVRGNWEWRNGAWAWIDGHWERERARQRWNEGRWERQGDRWVFVAGGWQTCPDNPDQPPPPGRIENNAPQPDRVWLPGRYVWRNCGYEWIPGALSRLNPGHHYVQGQWIPRDGHYVWTNGGWEVDATPPPPPPYRRPPPPPPRDEAYSPKPGFVWAKGHWEWRTDKYDWIPGHWERVRAGVTWVDAHWEQHGSEWVFVEGGWR
jgi:YXWGXW repeat-containing protein